MDLRDEIVLLEDPVWTDRFETERDRVADASGEGLLGVFHVGSTAIPDVPGKPALDVLAVFEDADAMAAATDALADGDYERHHGGPDSALVVHWGDDHAVFVKLHTRDDEKARNQIAFRDYLRDHPEARREYERVKREAAEAHPEDPEAYTQAKTDVVTTHVERAREAGYVERLPEFV